MKKISVILLSFILIFSSVSVSVRAEESVISTETYQDGDYTIIITTTVQPDNNTGARSAQSITASKTTKVQYNGKTIATFKLTASFRYTGSSATCIDSSAIKSILDSNWTFTTATSGKSGNFATGYYTVRHYVNGVEKDNKSGSLRITCDKNGNIS